MAGITGGCSGMALKVCKFGGTSLADANQIRKVKAIVESDPTRRFVVPSAPGKRSKQDKKITDLLYLCNAHVAQEVPFEEIFAIIEKRFRGIVKDLGLDLDLTDEFERIKRNIEAGVSPDYAASRGEYLNGLILAELLNAEFIDAEEVIFFDSLGRFDAAQTHQVMSERLSDVERGVIPGF